VWDFGFELKASVPASSYSKFLLVNVKLSNITIIDITFQSLSGRSVLFISNPLALWKLHNLYFSPDVIERIK
jgi:hypothetical protein